MPHGAKVAELSGFCLPEGVFDLIPVKAGLDDIISRQVVMRGHDNVLSKPGYMFVYPVVVLAKIQLELLI
jgi:hypothetical protein